MSTSTPITQSKRKRRSTRGQAAREREEKRQKIADVVVGNALVGACFDKRFIGYGTWTATIDAYNATTKKYTCRYVDGYIEYHTRDTLKKYGLFQPKNGEIVEPNTNPDEHPGLYIPSSLLGTGTRRRTNLETTNSTANTNPNSTASAVSTNNTAPASTTTTSSVVIMTDGTSNLPVGSPTLVNASRNNEVLMSDSDDEIIDENVVTPLPSTTNINDNNSGDVVDLTSDNDEDVIEEQRGNTNAATTTTTTSTSAATKRASSYANLKKKKRSGKGVKMDIIKDADVADVKPEPVPFGMADIPPEVIELSEADFYGPEEWAKINLARNGGSMDVKTKNSKRKSSNDDDIVFISSTDNTSTYELPHARKDCPVEKYQPYPPEYLDKKVMDARQKKRRLQNMKCCDKCYCMICEIPAKECKWWSLTKKPHCNALLDGGFDSSYWREQKIVLSNVFLRNESTISSGTKSAIKDTVSTLKRYFNQYHRGRETYEYDSDSDDGYGFFGFMTSRSRRFAHMSHSFDDINFYCIREIESIESWFKKYHDSTLISSGVTNHLIHGIAILDTLTEQIGRQTWSPLQNEVSCSSDVWDLTAEEKYDNIVLKLGKLWFRIFKPKIFGSENTNTAMPAHNQRKIKHGKCPISGLKALLVMETKYCKGHGLSKIGLQQYYKCRTSEKLVCPYPNCNERYTKYQYRDLTGERWYREQKFKTTGPYRHGITPIIIGEQLLDRLRLRLKDLLNITKTGSMRDMIQALLFSSDSLEVVKSGKFQPYRGKFALPKFYTSLAIENNEIDFAIKQVLSSRNMSMSSIFSNRTCVNKLKFPWHAICAACLSPNFSMEDYQSTLNAYKRRTINKYAEVANYVLTLRVFFGTMKEELNKSNEINLIEDLSDENSRTSDINNKGIKSTKTQTAEIAVDFKGKTMGLEICAGPFGRVYVNAKNPHYTPSNSCDRDSRDKIQVGDLFVSANTKHVTTIDAEIIDDKHGKRTITKVLEATNTIRSLNAPLRIILERPFYNTTIPLNRANMAVKLRDLLYIPFPIMHGLEPFIPSFDATIAAEKRTAAILLKGCNENIVRLLMYDKSNDAGDALQRMSYCEKVELLVASAAKFIMNSTCTKSLAKTFAKQLNLVYNVRLYNCRRLYRFVYWCCKFHASSTKFGKHFLHFLVTETNALEIIFKKPDVMFDINLTPSELKIRAKKKDSKNFYLEKFDINMIRILFSSSDTTLPLVQYRQLMKQIRSYELYLAKMKRPSILVGDFKKSMVREAVAYLKSFVTANFESASQCKPFKEYFNALPPSIQMDTEIKFLNIFRLFAEDLHLRKENSECCSKSTGRCRHNYKQAWSNLWVRLNRSTVEIKTKRDMLKTVFDKIYSKLTNENCHSLYRSHITKCLCCDNPIGYDSFEIYMINFYIAKDKFKIEIDKHLRQLIACPRKTCHIPGYVDSFVKTIPKEKPGISLASCGSYFDSGWGQNCTRKKIDFFASVLKNERKQFTPAQQRNIFDNFLPFFKFIMKYKRVERFRKSLWGLIFAARKHKKIALKGTKKGYFLTLRQLGADNEKHIVSLMKKALSLKIMKRTCLPMFKALKSHSLEARRTKSIYSVKINMVRNSSATAAEPAYKMNLSLAEIICKTKHPKTKKNFSILAVEELMPNFNVNDFYGYHPSLKNKFTGANRQVKVGDVLYKVQNTKVLGKSMKEVKRIVTILINQNKYNMYNGFTCTFIRTFKDCPEMF